MKDIIDPEKRKLYDAFDEGLLAIEEKHIDFFREREPKNDSEQHDRLHNHHIFWDQGGRITFAINKDSDLPRHIRKECLDFFNEIFNQK